MCLLIVVTGVVEDYPVLVASNRDEDRARPASPPGLFVGAQRKMLSPRDRRGGGTWLAINDRGMVAGITNVAGAAHEAAARSRGHLPHLALDTDDVAAACRAVQQAVAKDHYNAFQLVIANADARAVLRHVEGRLHVEQVTEPVMVLSNEHRLGALRLPGLEPALAGAADAARCLEAMRPLLLDEGGDSGHRVLKKGGTYGTVSSSLIGVPREDPRQLIWRYAPGPPDEVDYRNYGNLGRRLSDAV